MPGCGRGQGARCAEPGSSTKLQDRSTRRSCFSEGWLKKPSPDTTVCIAGPYPKPGLVSYPGGLSGVLGDEVAKIVAPGVKIPAL